MRLTDEQELTKLKMNFYRLINFILAATIIGTAVSALGYVGMRLWG